MTTTTGAVEFGTPTALTCSLGSLAASSTAGRSSAAFDNTAGAWEDVALDCKFKTGASAPTGDKTIYVYVYASMDGTNFGGSSAEAVGSDVAVTLDSPTNLVGPIAISAPSAATTYRLSIGSLAALFGFIPQKGGVVAVNGTGNALDGTGSNHGITWTGLRRKASTV